MFRKLLVIFSLLSLLFTFVIMGGTASAANSGATTDFVAMQKWCAVIEVHLSGNQHTSTCLQTYRSNGPDLARVACGNPTSISIENYNNSATLCFYGRGYLGVNIFSVNLVVNESQFDPAYMWMRYYNNGAPGVTCTIPPYDFKDFGSGTTNVKVTQLDFGASSGPGC